MTSRGNDATSRLQTPTATPSASEAGLLESVVPPTAGSLVGALLVLLLALGGAPGPVAALQQPLQPYAMTDQWPRTGAAAAGVIQRPVSMDVSPDGLLFISDPGAGGVHRMLPGGQFLSLLGAAGSRGAELREAGPLATGPSPGLIDRRLYVVDAADDRVVVFDLDGAPTDIWPNVFGAAAITVTDSGTVFVADQYSGWVRAFDLHGAALYSWGALGTGPGQFDGFTNISALPDGSVVAVGDLGGKRVQLFDVSGGGGAEGPTLRRTFDLLDTKYSGCLADSVHLLGEDDVWVGQGDHACRLAGEQVTPVIAPSAYQDTICRDTVSIPLVRLETSQFYALAIHDPNLGPCGNKQTERGTSVVVVQYHDADMWQVAHVWPAAPRSSLGAQLISPQSIAWVGAERLAVRDESPYLHFFRPDGRYAGSTIHQAPAPPGNADTYEVRVAAATDVEDEFLAYYEHARPQGRYRVHREFGVGRFREAVRYYAGEPVSVFEPVWSDVLEAVWTGRSTQPSYAFREFVEIDLAYNAVTDEAVLLYFRRALQRGTQDARLRRWRAGDGVMAAGSDMDLPNDLEANPFIDLSVGADGRVYALNGLDDLAVVVGNDGRHVRDVPLSTDAWQITGGPGGELFALRASGYVEQVERDGTVTTSFDGRPLPASDPTTLTDLAADESGRVYTLDGQVGVVSVFEQTEDYDAEAPTFATCLLRGHKTASPAHVVVGQPVTITLTLDGQCGIGETPSDIMLVVPADEVDDVSALRNLLAQVDLGVHRAGLVTYWDTAHVELELSGEPADVVAGIRSAARRQWGETSRRRPRLAVAVAEAHEHLAPDSDRRQVMLLFRPSDDQELDDAPLEAAVREAIADRIEVMLFEASIGFHYLASSPEAVVDTVAAAQRQMVDYHRPKLLARQLVLTDTVGTGMTLVPGSLQPLGNVSGRDVRWTSASVGVGGARFTLQVIPQAPGRQATNGAAVARFVDGWGLTGEIEFPAPIIDVDPAPTATATATAEPIVTAVSTPADHVWILHVPWAAVIR